MNKAGSTGAEVSDVTAEATEGKESSNGEDRHTKRLYESTSAEGYPSGSRNKKSKSENSEASPAPVINKAVYIQGLPLDVTVDEIEEVFKKCGVIAKNIDNGTPRIKIYRTEDGTPKGDALIVFFRSESVELAEQLFDDTEFRYGSGQKMRVQKANIDYKKEKTVNKDVGGALKKKALRLRQQQMQQISSWDDVDEEVDDKRKKRFNKIVVLKHIFTLEELDKTPELLIDLKDDITEEAEKCGRVTNVVLYDKEPDGVVTVRFSNNEEAEACVRLMQGRYFDGRVVEASIYDGKVRFQKSGKHTLDDEEDEEKRLEKFADWLENSN